MITTIAIMGFALIGLITVVHWIICWGEDKRVEEAFVARIEARENALKVHAADVERYRIEAEAYVKSAKERLEDIEREYGVGEDESEVVMSLH